jgi:hypothetical protein
MKNKLIVCGIIASTAAILINTLILYQTKPIEKNGTKSNENRRMNADAASGMKPIYP